VKQCVEEDRSGSDVVVHEDTWQEPKIVRELRTTAGWSKRGVLEKSLLMRFIHVSVSFLPIAVLCFSWCVLG
jgi:hypothetical protein